jgi:UDP-glucose 4-epimerase
VTNKNLNIVLGGAGFIGFNLIRNLVNSKQHVLVIDDLSNSIERDLFLRFIKDNEIRFFNFDINEIGNPSFNQVINFSNNFDKIYFWHLAANSDIRASIENPLLDLDKTLKTTLSAINLSSQLNKVTMIFSSSSAIYGSQPNKILREDEILLEPTSNYGITKLASEMFLKNSLNFEFENLIIFRFPNILGTPSTHGVIHDWMKQANQHRSINVLGDGTQQKQYMNVKTLVDCMTYLVKKNDLKLNIFNIGPNDYGVSVKYLMNIFQKYWQSPLEVSYQSENIGWRGDVNKYRMDVSKIINYGWKSEIFTQQEVEKSIIEMIDFSKSN